MLVQLTNVGGCIMDMNTYLELAKGLANEIKSREDVLATLQGKNKEDYDLMIRGMKLASLTLNRVFLNANDK